MRARFVVLAGWAVLLLACAPLAPRVFQRLQPGGFGSDRFESQRAADELQRQLGYNPATLVVVFSSDRLRYDDQAFRDAQATALARVRDDPDVASVVTQVENARQGSTDGHAAYATIALRSAPEAFRTVVPRVRAELAPTELQTVITGAPIFYADILAVTERDLRRAELTSFPFAALALLLVFGSVVGAIVPALMGGTAVLVTLGALVLISGLMELSIFALNLVTMLGLGLGIDYSLFIVSRFREELARGLDVEQAVASTVATAGKAVLVSGLTVFVGLLGLIWFEYMALRSMGVAGALVVACSVATALTLLPAALAIVGHRVNALPVLRHRDSEGGFWAGLAQRVMRRPGLVFCGVLLLLGLLGSPFLRVQLGAPDASILPRDVESRRGFDLLRERFGAGELAPITINVHAPGSIFDPTAIDALSDFVDELRQDDRVLRVDSIVSLDPRISRDQYKLLYRPALRTGDAGRIPDAYARGIVQEITRPGYTLVRVTSRYGQTTPESKSLVEQIRATRLGAGLAIEVGGGTAGVVDYVDGLYGGFPPVLLFVVISTYLLLLALLRSVLLPLKAIVMNTLSLVASYGALVAVVQEGMFAKQLGFTPPGFVEASLPIIMFCVLFGLSMDYEVFLLARIKEAYDQSGENTASVAQGLERSGRIITSAALIIVLVSGSFALADIVLIKALGLGTAVAVLLDATVVRALLVPATMRLLGSWNWWMPGRADRPIARRAPAPELE
ncbi:MAG: MMPL family transporter [Chloroflexi bacterium]|nr:MMPL family transporter [Chloroflexota bacterium]